MKLIRVEILPGFRKGARIAKRRAKDVAGGAIAGALVAGLAMAPAPSNAAEATASDGHRFPRCQQEDSTACLWDARHMGNGVGRSFVAGEAYGQRHYYRHSVVHAIRARDNFRTVPARIVGTRWDTPAGGTFTIDASDVWSVGGTSYVVNERGQVGTS